MPQRAARFGAFAKRDVPKYKPFSSMANGKKRKTRTQQGYSNRWLRAAKAYKVRHPLCVMCEAEGIVTPAYAVDHIIPHKGDNKLFWDESNWQSLCQHHHNAKSATER